MPTHSGNRQWGAYRQVGATYEGAFHDPGRVRLNTGSVRVRRDFLVTRKSRSGRKAAAPVPGRTNAIWAQDQLALKSLARPAVVWSAGNLARCAVVWSAAIPARPAFVWSASILARLVAVQA